MRYSFPSVPEEGRLGTMKKEFETSTSPLYRLMRPSDSLTKYR